MTQFAIMRCEKVNNWGAMSAAFQHEFRERKTLNAGPNTADNVAFYAASTEAAMEKAKSLMPEKVRKNAVLGIQYIMTASPEWFAGASEEQRKQFFQRSLDWLKQKYGEQNIVTATIHYDETTPHLTAVVIPIDSRGKLNARGFIGSRALLRSDQTSFARAVADLGLERGIQNSKAHHKLIAEWYGEMHKGVSEYRKALVTEDELKPKSTSWLFQEGRGMVADRINERLKTTFVHAQMTEQLQKDNHHLKNQIEQLHKDCDNLTDKLSQSTVRNQKLETESQHNKLMLEVWQKFIEETFQRLNIRAMFQQWLQKKREEQRQKREEEQRRQAEAAKAAEEKRRQEKQQHSNSRGGFTR